MRTITSDEIKLTKAKEALEEYAKDAEVDKMTVHADVLIKDVWNVIDDELKLKLVCALIHDLYFRET